MGRERQEKLKEKSRVTTAQFREEFESDKRKENS
jgi:hypothetical protein